MVTIILFKSKIKRQLHAKLKVVQVDGRGEFKPLMTLLQQEEIFHKVLYPYISQQNWVMKCRHRRIVKKGMTLLLSAYMLIVMWSYLGCLLLRYCMEKLLSIMFYKCLVTSVSHIWWITIMISLIIDVLSVSLLVILWIKRDNYV